MRLQLVTFLTHCQTVVKKETITQIKLSNSNDAQLKNADQKQKKQRWYKAAGKAKTLIFLHRADLLLKKAKYKRMKLLKCKNTKIKNTSIKNAQAI